ncbi:MULTISPECIES: hypothetical protein [unclassified Bifidobacterium]|uniref:hypothetical protein n=1 Tax=unclassified Bifidobacterium TaxID=2608897 RepID=UPI0023F83D78|nr:MULTISPECIES: hypothetical protein [unclassified Bifidobacterium]WEV66031.1 hypothetical protein OZX71_01360 [Bifidobacterium sp. ESL0764]WEV75177.1 hypothetical protein OZX75_05890 [Bifidobacterium sp. ESL0800]
MPTRNKGFDGPEIIQSFALIAAALAARADNVVADVLLVTLTGCVVVTCWKHRRK